MSDFEVLSPAGDVESLKAAIMSGADAVYFGLNKFNARLKADNISIDNLDSVVSYAHLKGVKTYVTINTLLSDSEMLELVEMVGLCLRAGVDAFIVQDYGVIGVLKQVYPNIVLHGSTQLGVHNVRGARVAKSLGLTRVVLSREVTLDDIREIRDNVDIELEVFVQGAMCVCFSGNCYLSSLKFGASGNRGLCKQLCRLPYTMKAGNKTKTGYMLSPRDNCMLDYLSELCALGVCSFKIEGRLRRKGYVSIATKTYRKAIDSIISDTQFDLTNAKTDLKKVFSRGDFVPGYFAGKNIIAPRFNSHMGVEVGKLVKCEPFKNLYRYYLSLVDDCILLSGDGLKVVCDNGDIESFGVGNIEKNGNYIVVYGKNCIKPNSTVYRTLDIAFESNVEGLSKKRKVSIVASMVIGKPLEFSATVDGFAQIKIVGDVVQEAQKQPLQKEKIIENLSKWDSVVFDIVSVEFDNLDNNIFVAVSAINEARRLLVDKVSATICESFKKPFVKNDVPKIADKESVTNRIAIIDEKCNVANIASEYSEFVLAPSIYSLGLIKSFYEKNKAILNTRLYINLPNIALKDDLKIIDALVDFACENSLGIMINNIYALDYAKRGIRMIASSNMNVTNRYAVDTLEACGVDDIVFSCEKWAPRVAGTYKLGSGKRVLMTLAHCPNVTLCQEGCDCVNNSCSHRGELTLCNDNNSYKIRRYKVHNCYFELLDEYRDDKQTNGVVVDLRK